jgi:endoglucanase
VAARCQPALSRLSTTVLALLVAAMPSLPAAAASPAAASPAAAASGAARAVHGLVRVDQVGYPSGEAKLAYLMTTAPLRRPEFDVVDGRGRVVFHGRAGADRGGWNAPYAAVYPLDVTPLHATGTYRIRVSDGVTATSPTFRVASPAALLRPLISAAAGFFQAQRDGGDVVPGPLHRQPSHLNDAHASIYAWPRYKSADSDVIDQPTLTRLSGQAGGVVDVEGGWFDAGDFIKFTHTTAYASTLLLVAERSLGRSAPAALDEQARVGLDWLGKTWNPARNTMVIQVGIGSGNVAGTFNGDHDLWRLPERDDQLTGSANRYLRNRPVFVTDAAPGRLAPNLAGRVAASFALAAQLDAARNPRRARSELALAADIFARAKTQGVRPADVVTALPHAFYPESSWRDDLELGAVELARAGRLLHDRRAEAWLAAAERWAAAYRANEAGGDTLNLYDVSALADAELLSLISASTSAAGRAAVRDLRRQLATGQARASADPFRAGGNYDDFDVASHTFGLAASAQLYRARTGGQGYRRFESAQMAWVFGANPWGVSMMIGAGTTFPKCPQHVVANLSGTLNGRAPVLAGAVVNGPNQAALFDEGLGDFFGTGRACPPGGADPYAAFSGKGSRFVDDVRSWQTVEPAIDFTATAVLALSLASRSPRPSASRPGPAVHHSEGLN